VGVSPVTQGQWAAERSDDEGAHGVTLTRGFWVGVSPVTQGQWAAERSDDEGAHGVTLTRGFWVGVSPVTQGQWAAVMGENPSHFQGDGLPVETVSWEDAETFCGKVSALTGMAVRLPSEAEWEYVCRAGTDTPFYWGGVLNGTEANCDGEAPYGTETAGPYLKTTTPVGSYAAVSPHPWGLWDVHGSVWEWCADWYDEGFYGRSPEVEPLCQDGEQMYRVLRGGSWGSYPLYCRAAFRFRNVPGYRSLNFGFRVVFCLD
jgi:formylglycine-generating enzyme required for sulfatase activity